MLALYRSSRAALATLVAVALGGCAGSAELAGEAPEPASTPGPADSGPVIPSASASATGSAAFVERDEPRERHEETLPDACSTLPGRSVAYTNPDELRALLVGRWQRCSAPELPGEDVGVEFTDDHYYPLTRDESGQVIRLAGGDHEYRWNYVPVEGGYFIVDSVQTGLPKITDEPRQLRVLFSPVPSKYVPLE